MNAKDLRRGLERRQERLLGRKNAPDRSFYNGVLTRFVHPVLTADHVPLAWRYDWNLQTNPLVIERLGINSVFNSGALYLNGTYLLMARVEGTDRKSFFAIAESQSPVSGFRFRPEPVVLADLDPEETNVYDVRLIHHEDGWIYGIYCAESKDPLAPKGDTAAAVAKAAMWRTRDFRTFEKLPDLVTPSPQQRNVTLHPEFVDGKYLLYTRPQDGFIETGSGGGIAYGFVESMENPVIKTETLLDPKRYHTIYETKNGAGPSPIKTAKGWIHIAHGVRNTAAGLRYVLYAFATALDDPTRVIAKPSGYLLAPRGEERIGDVSNVVFCNGAVRNDQGRIYLYYGSSDTRLHVAETTEERLMDYVFHNPPEAFRSADAVRQRLNLIQNNSKRSDHQ